MVLIKAVLLIKEIEYSTTVRIIKGTFCSVVQLRLNVLHIVVLCTTHFSFVYHVLQYAFFILYSMSCS